MAGLGSRFSTQGYDKPKPLIEFLGKPMVQHVIEHLGLQQLTHVLICQKSHVEKYRLYDLFASFLNDYHIIEVDGVTEGAAITVSLADAVIDDTESVMIVNSDQLVEWDRDVEYLEQRDGCIFCFHGEGTNWSYAEVNESGYVTKVAEKIQISNHATSGMYFWKQWKDFKDALRLMIIANDRTNNEFYTAPVYNWTPKKIQIKYVDAVHQVGTPEELSAYLQKINNTD